MFFCYCVISYPKLAPSPDEFKWYAKLQHIPINKTNRSTKQRRPAQALMTMYQFIRKIVILQVPMLSHLANDIIKLANDKIILLGQFPRQPQVLNIISPTVCGFQ